MSNYDYKQYVNTNGTYLYESDVSCIDPVIKIGDQSISKDDIKYLHELQKHVTIKNMKQEEYNNDINIRVADNGFIAITEDSEFVFSTVDKLTKWVSDQIKFKHQKKKDSNDGLNELQRSLLEKVRNKNDNDLGRWATKPIGEVITSPNHFNVDYTTTITTGDAP